MRRIARALARLRPSALMGRRLPPDTALIVEELEPRILYSADPATLLQPDYAAPAAEARVLEPAPLFGTATAEAYDTAQHAPRREVVFIDAGVQDADELLANLSRDSSRVIDVVRLGAEVDGVQQIANVLARYQGLDAVHIVSHATDAAVQLGATVLDQASLDANAALIERWGLALSDDADLLFYGCDLAASGSGTAFIDALARLTGADVAASTDPTGTAALGGDWDLEYRVGAIETGVALTAAGQQSWAGLLAVNAAPVNTVPATQQADVTGTLVFSSANSNAISISDPDAGASPVQVTLTGTTGTVTLSGTTGLTFSAGDGTADAAMTFTGTITDVNAALNGMRFNGDAFRTGNGSLQITTNDLGNTGTGGAQSDTDTVTVNMLPIGTPFILSGSYTGNSADNRAITGLGFQPDVVIVSA
jgi:hypothetical protein